MRNTEQPERISVSFYYPAPKTENTTFPEMNNLTAAWANKLSLGRVELREEIIRQNPGDWAAMALPQADLEVVRLFSDYLVWFLVLDDDYCENSTGHGMAEMAELFSWLIRIAEHPDSPILNGDPVADGLRDIVNRISALASEHLTLSFVEAMRGFFLSLLWEASFRERKAQATLEEYALLRTHNGMMRPYSLLLELGAPEELTPKERDSQPVRALIEMAVFILLFDNDVLSYGKENRQRNDGRRYNQNPVSILQHQHGLSHREAILRTMDLRNRAMSRYMDLHDHVLTHASSAVAHFINNLDTMTRACFDWSLPTERYRVWDGPVLPSPTDVRPQADSTPLPFAAISWWWESNLMQNTLA